MRNNGQLTLTEAFILITGVVLIAGGAVWATTL
jgi:hypothetical protein